VSSSSPPLFFGSSPSFHIAQYVVTYLCDVGFFSKEKKKKEKKDVRESPPACFLFSLRLLNIAQYDDVFVLMTYLYDNAFVLFDVFDVFV